MAYTQRKHRCKGADTCALWAVVVFALLHLVFGLASATDADEHQMLVNGWCIADGLRLYEDFWDNHGPLFNYLCAALVGRLPQDHAVIYAARFVMWLNTLVVAWLVWRIAKENLPGAPWTQRAAVLVFLADAIVLEKATEIRADNPFNLCWMAALWLALRGARSGSAAAWFGAGLCLGVAFGFSVKVVMIGFALFLVMAALMARARRILWRPMFAAAAGFALPVALILAWLAAAGIWAAFFRAVVSENFGREHILSLKAVRDWVKNDALMGAAVTAYAVDAWRRARRGTLDPGERLLIPAVAFLFFQYFFLLPSQNHQSLLPALTAVSPLLGWALVRWWNAAGALLVRSARTRARAAVRWAPAALGIALACLAYHRLAAVRVWPPFLWRQVQAANAILRVTGPDEKVYDCIGSILYRRRPGYYPVTTRYELGQHRNGAIDLRIPGSLEEQEVRLVLMAYREAMLRDGDLEYLLAHFVPLRLAPPAHGLVLGAGGHTRMKGGETTVTVRVAGRYGFISSPPSPAPVLDDGGNATASLDLAPGTHRVRTAGDVTEIAWTAFPPEMMASMEDIRRYCSRTPEHLRNWLKRTNPMQVPARRGGNSN